MSDEECVRAPRRGKRSALHLESSSDSESDGAVEVVTKKKKMNIIESESSSESSASSEDDTGVARPIKKRPRVGSDNESSSEDSSNESSEESDESSCEDSDDNITPRVRGRNGRLTRTCRVESEEESSSESESDESSSESGHSSAGSYESYDEEAMIQAAIQESLASATVKPSEAENPEPSQKTAAKKTVVSEAGGFASDTSDGESEKCPICLLSFTDQEIGSPETCDHTFCSVCIQEWAKNVNTCPVDRQVFSLILVRKQLNGKVIKKIPIANREARDPQESDSDPTFCEVCGRSDREDRLLLCDGCDLGYHLECLNPPMENVPIEEWFCPECATDQSSPLAEEVDVQDGELNDLLDDMVQIRPRTSRLLPRTRQSERVRATLRSLHQEFLHGTHEPALQQPSTSGIESVGADSSSVASGARVTSAASASTVRRRKVVRRKTVKKRRKRRTTKRTTKRKPVRRKKKVTKKVAVKGSGDEETEEIEEYVTKTKRRKRRKRKIRRRKKVSRRKTARTAVPRSVKGRLAEQLGLCAPSRPGMSLPVIRSRVTASDIDLQRSRAGIPTLHIYGPQNELDYFSSDNEDVIESGSLAVAARPRNARVGSARLIARKKLSAAALQSHTAVISPKPVRNRVNMEGNAVASNSPVDLIGSILDSQAIWHSKKSSVTIKPDGSLEVNKDLGGTAVANTQGTVECDSVSNKNKSNDSLIRSDDRLSEVNGSSTSPIDLGSASARTTQAPMYPGRGDNHNRPPPSSGFHQFGGSRYSAPSYSNYQSGRDFSNFSSSSSNFDASSTRAGYSNYLNSGLPPAPLRNTPVRFRVTPRYPIRRPQGPQRPQDSSKHDDKRPEDDGEGCQKTLEGDEDDEIDIYSDIEAGGAGSGGPSGGGSELDETERSMETSYEALPPPPEPSALLMGFGEQALSEEEPTSDNELVIDDNVGPSSPHDQNETSPQIPESEKYDPAEPLADSDEDNDDDDNGEPETAVPVRNEVPDQDIPLPPAPPASIPFQSSTNISQHIINSSSNSNASYLHSPTYGETSFETDKISAVTNEGVVNKVVKEVISERLKNASGIIGVSVVRGSPTRPNVGREDEEDECPNFSIYSATSMDIARRTGEETIDVDSKIGDEKICETSENESKEEREMEDIENDKKSDKMIPESEDKSKSLPEDGSPAASPDVKQAAEITVLKDGSEEKEEEDEDDEDEDADAKKEFSEEEEEEEETHKVDSKDKDDDKNDTNDDKNDMNDEFAKADLVGKNDQPVQELKENESDSSIEDLSPGKIVSDADDKDDEDKDEHDVTNADISNEKEEEEIEKDDKGKSLTPTKELDITTEETPCRPPTNDTFDSDNDSVIGDVPSAVSVVVRNKDPPATSAPSGLEGLDTETISETEEAINFDDLSQDGNDIPSAEEDGEISSAKKRKKKKSRRNLDVDGKMLSDLSGELPADRERTPPEEGEIIDDRPKLHDTSKREKISVENKDVSHELETSKVSDENFDISKSKDDDKKKKKKEKRKSTEKGVDRPVLGSSENRRKSKEKSRRSEEPNISWKKPSKSTKERNYRDTKTSKPDDTTKEKDKDNDSKDTNKKKKKEKRKDMERYDVRKIVSDKRRRRKDEFGRDLSRDRSCSRSRSRSHRRSRSLSKSRRHRSPVRARRSRSRSRYRSRSRSYRRSRSKSKNRSRRKSKDKGRRSRSKDRTRVRLSRSRSRGRRSRSRSGSHNRSKNKARLRSRSRSPVKQRKDRADRSHVVREVQRFHTRRSWSRTWTPSWSRSRSHSISCSSFTQSRSPSVRHFNRSFSHSFSRSWSRERYERIPLEKTGTLSGKPTKKLTVIVSNTKENSGQKKDKKKKKDKKNKELLGTMEKRKKRKEKSPAPSKEVFTSGDNILVSVNFNKTSKTGTNKDLSSSLPALSKEASKRKREETFETDREISKKIRKEKNKEKNKGIPNEKNAVGLQVEKKGKKQGARGNKSARMAALLKQKPVAIIDLDQSPFREQTPSPRDLIVLSDSDDDVRNKGVEREEIGEALSVCRNLRPDISSPQSPAKGVHNVPANISVARSPETELKLMSAVSNYLTTSTGPKTPPEPQIKFSIATKQPQLRVINNPLQEDDDILPEDGGLDDSDQRIEEELDRSLGEIVYKGPNTPPEPRGPTTPCSPPTSPDAYDPFDPTKSGTPSPAGPEASMDGPPSPPRTPADDLQMGIVEGSAGRDSPLQSDLEDMVNKNAEARNKSPPMQPTEEVTEEARSSPKVVTRETKSPVGISETIALTPQLQNEELPVAEITDVSKVSHGLPSNISSVSISEGNTKSPERKIGVVITTPQSKLQSTPIKPPVFPVPSLKQAPTSQQTMTSTPSHAAPPPIFPSLTPVNIASMLCTPTANLALSRTNLFTPQTPMSVPSLLQHVSNAATPVQARLSTDKSVVPAVPIRSLVQNGEQLPKPQDTTTEVVDMDLDSPYSPGSSEGDDLFDPPADTPTRTSQPSHTTDRPKTGASTAKNANKLAVPASNLPSHKSPSKNQDKFDSLFGMAGAPTKAPGSAPSKGRTKGHKGTKAKTKHVKGGKKEIAIKMDEDQLQILDELPSSAVELQVKDKFLKKLNRQERVVEEVKLSLKPHYNRKHISKEEYKDILRKSVPKICHNKSGEINPVKIATLVEAYVKKVRYEKKKSANSSSGTNSTPAKAKVTKTTKWS